MPSNLTILGSGVFSASSLVSIDLKSVSSISYGVFENCKNLKSIILPNTLKTIGESAFAFSGLESIVIPDSVESIARFAFNSCLSLKTVTLPNSSVEGGMIYNENFVNCAALESVTIPANTQSINTAFSGCTSLKEISFEGPTKMYPIFGYNVVGNMTKVNITSLEDWLNMEFISEFSNPMTHGAKLYINNVAFDYDLTGVTQIQNYAFINCDAQSLVLPESLTSLGQFAFKSSKNLTTVQVNANISELYGTFQSCESLKNVTLNNNITSLSYTFDGCVSLEEITLPDTITTLVYTFSGCEKLASVNIPATFDDELSSGVFKNCKALTKVLFPEGLTTIGSYMFYGTGIQELEIPESVVKIGAYAFSECDNIKTVVLPETITNISEGIFSGCDSLESLQILGAAIGDYAFADCKLLTNVNLGDKITKLSSGMFANCENLKQISIPASLRTIMQNAFENTGLTQIEIPATVTSLGTRVFANCADLKTVKLLCQIKTMPDYLFENCTSLVKASDITYSEEIKLLGEGMFKGCTGLTEFPLPANLENFPEYCFSGCTSIDNLTFTSWESDFITLYYSLGALENCTSLKTITIGEGFTRAQINLARLFNNPTTHVAVEYIYLPSTLIYVNAVDCNQYCTVKNIVYHKDMVATASNISENTFMYCDLQNEIYIPEGVVTISKNAFKDKTGLTKISLPSTITTVQEYAFKNVTAEIEWRNPTITTLKTKALGYYLGEEFTMPYSVTTVENNAFYQSTTKKINIRNVNDWAKINFANYESNPLSSGAHLYKNDELVTKIQLSTSIGNYAFAGCNDLTDVYLFTSANAIGTEAFRSCNGILNLVLDITDYSWVTENLNVFVNSSISNLYFSASEQEYAEHQTELSYLALTPNEVYFYSETRPTVSGNYFCYVNGKPVQWVFISDEEAV